VVTEKVQGSFDFALISLRELNAALRMTSMGGWRLSTP
jgi:hypothetical protein